MLLAFVVAVVVGRGIRMADVRAADPLTAPELAGELRLRTPLRRIPLPPVGVALAAVAVSLETAGYGPAQRDLRWGGDGLSRRRTLRTGTRIAAT